MAKGKKTIIKEIKKIDDEILLINGKEYVIVEDTENIETATTMKISSNGNRILRFEDEKKKATIDVKRDPQPPLPRQPDTHATPHSPARQSPYRKTVCEKNSTRPEHRIRAIALFGQCSVDAKRNVADTGP